METRYAGFVDEGEPSASFPSLAYPSRHERRSSVVLLDRIKHVGRRSSAWTSNMMFRGGQRALLYAAVVAGLLLIIFVPQTTLPQKTKAYVEKLGGAKEKPIFNSDRWFYQNELEALAPIEFDWERLKNLPPHNYQGPGHETYATLYATRNGHIQDPYFVAAQQIVFRLLWRQRTKSKHPVTVFVTQYVNQTQRDYFTAAGAIVRELAIRPFTPEMAGIPARLQDMFSKLEMWRQLDFSRIAYLDSDAIPIEHCDDIFDFAPDLACNHTLLPDEDKPVARDICNYAFAARHEGGDGNSGQGGINAGVMVFKPEQAMYQRLVRESQNKDGWDTGYMEQALLSKLYNEAGPFPPSNIGMGYNSFPNYNERFGVEIKILHDKMWAHYFDNGTWMDADWTKTYEEMERFYASEAFYETRLADQKAVLAKLEKDAKVLARPTALPQPSALPSPSPSPA